MDREQEEVQFLGFFGIFKKSFKIISSWRKIFAQITLSLILPLSFISLAQIQISHLIFSDIQSHHETRKISDLVSLEWAAFWGFKLAYFTFLLVLSLLSTSAIVYTIASVYTGKPIAYTKVMSVVPKVWRRLMVTFLWGFATVFAYNVVAVAVVIALAVLFGESSVVGNLVIVGVVGVYALGLLYITVVWHLASVVSVLEDCYGWKAMAKSKNLIKGKTGGFGGGFCGDRDLFRRDPIRVQELRGVRGVRMVGEYGDEDWGGGGVPGAAGDGHPAGACPPDSALLRMQIQSSRIRLFSRFFSLQIMHSLT